MGQPGSMMHLHHGPSHEKERSMTRSRFPRRIRLVLPALAIAGSMLASLGAPAMPSHQWPRHAVAPAEAAAVLISISSVSPASGPTSGGTSVVINGTGFVNVISVTFGAVDAAAVLVDQS